MTDKLKETFNLPELEEILDDLKENNIENIDEDTEKEFEEVKNTLQNIEYSDIKEYSEDGIDELESEMDKVIEVGLSEFKDMIDYAYNIEAKNAAGVMGAAAKILELTVSASKIKQEQKMKAIELKMKQELQDHNISMDKGNFKPGEVVDKNNEGNQSAQGKVINRAEYLRDLINKQKSDDQ